MKISNKYRFTINTNFKLKINSLKIRNLKLEIPPKEVIC